MSWEHPDVLITSCFDHRSPWNTLNVCFMVLVFGCLTHISGVLEYSASRPINFQVKLPAIGSLLFPKVLKTLRYWSFSKFISAEEMIELPSSWQRARRWSWKLQSYDSNTKLLTGWMEALTGQMKGNPECLFNTSKEKDDNALSGFCSLYI